ncbi:MAG: ABC transporter substrate-binding protein [Cyclobacteriaceae bacterium]
MIRIGVSADLSANGSIHQHTFKEAVHMAFDNLRLADLNGQLVWENDFATEEGGKNAAQALLAKHVDFVVGHYASAAAKGALPYYETSGIPVFLPAATSDVLTTTYRSAFRTCGKDSDLARFVSESLGKKPRHKMYIEHDYSAHGFSLFELIRKNLEKNENVVLVDRVDVAEKVLFIGNFANSVNFLKEIDQQNTAISEVYFTDDLVHPKLPAAVKFTDKKVQVFGYDDNRFFKRANEVCAQYYRKWGSYPATYFLETYAAMEIIHQVASEFPADAKILKHLMRKSWDTVLGSLSFDSLGDSDTAKYALWQIKDSELISRNVEKFQNLNQF